MTSQRNRENLYTFTRRSDYKVFKAKELLHCTQIVATDGEDDTIKFAYPDRDNVLELPAFCLSKVDSKSILLK